MSAAEVIQALKEIDLMDESSLDLLTELRRILEAVDRANSQKIEAEISFLESIGVDLKESVDLSNMVYD
jgi:hypothetical protein